MRKRASTDRGVRLTNPDRVLYAEQGITKRALAEYYAAVARWMLPHVAGRILTVVRCPEGRHKDCFYQKHAMRGMPASIRRAPIREKRGTGEYMVIDDVDGLVSLVQIGVLEIHAWGAHEDNPERPDQLVFDLDPGEGVPWPRVVEATETVRDRLADLGLRSFLKTSGGKGLHVVAPIARRVDWETAKAFSRAVAEEISAAASQKYTANMAKARRRGRVFIDYLRNSRGATSVCPYSTRARPGAPVSAPVDWRELSGRLRPDSHNTRNVLRRLSALDRDPWAGYFDIRQSITATMLREVGARRAG